MDEVSCLIFELDQYRYAIETTAVAGIVDAPPLGPRADLPGFVLGEAQIGGKPVPVLDLHRLLGHSESAALNAEQLIVTRAKGGEAALAPKKIVGTRLLPVHGSVRMRDPGGEKPQGWKYIARLVSIDLALVMVLDPEAILAALQPEAAAAPRDLPGDADAAMAAWLADAAVQLEGEPSADRLTESLFEDFYQASLVAVIRWNGRSYGVPLHQVEEFSEVSRITPLPGCPPHIRGQAVLRGELVTIVDVRPALGLDLPECRLPLTAPLPLVLLRQEEERIGIVIDEVREIVTAAARDDMARASRSFISGSIPCGGGLLDILDLQELLSSEAVVVDHSR